MARSLSATVTTLLAGEHHTCHLLEFTVDGTTYRFTDGDAITHGGNAYTATLALESPVRLTEKLQVDPVTVRLVNVNLAGSELLLDEQPNLSGVEATLSRLYLEAREAIVLVKGRIGVPRVDERDVVFSIASGDLDPTSAMIPKREYSHLHSDGRTFVEMQGTNESHLFDGFFHLTREVTEEIEGHLPDEHEDNRTDWRDLPD